MLVSTVLSQNPRAIRSGPTGENIQGGPDLEFEMIFDQPVLIEDSNWQFGGLPSNIPRTLRSDFDSALEFTDVSHRAISSGPIDLDGDFTVEFWFKTELPGQIGVFSYAVPGMDNAITYFANGGFWANNIFFGFAPAATLNRWHHVAIVRDTVNLRLKVYFDGVETNDIASGATTTPNGSIVLGDDQDALLGGYDPA